MRGARGSLPRGAVPLALPLAIALLLLVPRLGWGFLSTAPGVSVVHTAEPDEHHVTEGLLRMSLSPFRPDPGDLSWGGLSFSLHFALLSGADALGAFPGGWRAALLSGDLARAAPVLLTLRAFSAACALATAGIAFVLARRRRGIAAGLLAAALVAVSPAMVLSGRTFVTDALQTALVAAAFLPASPAAAGLLLGLAAGTKYSALVFLPALAFSVGAARWRALLWAVPLGFTLAAPFTLFHARSLAGLLLAELSGAHGTGSSGFPALFEVWRWNASNAALYLVGPVGLALAVRALLRRRREPRGAPEAHGRGAAGLGMPVFLVAGQTVWLAVSNFVVVRYELPLVPFLAAWAAEALVDARRPRARAALAGLALAPPAALSFLLVFGVAKEHPFESAGRLLRAGAPAGARVGHVWPGMPQLPGLASESLRAFSNGAWDQAYVVDDDLPPRPYPPAYLAVRSRDYEAWAAFGGPPCLGGIAWPRTLTPHDARYVSPRVRVWRRRPSSGVADPPGLGDAPKSSVTGVP